MCFGYPVYYLVFAFYFYGDIFFHSTPEFLKPVLRLRTAFYCDDEWMGEQQQNNNKYQSSPFWVLLLVEAWTTQLCFLWLNQLTESGLCIGGCRKVRRRVGSPWKYRNLLHFGRSFIFWKHIFCVFSTSSRFVCRLRVQRSFYESGVSIPSAYNCGCWQLLKPRHWKNVS